MHLAVDPNKDLKVSETVTEHSASHFGLIAV